MGDGPSFKPGASMIKAIHPLAVETKHFSPWYRPRGDGFVFRMHCCTTVLLLMGCCLLNAITQYFGSKIACIVNKDSVPQKVIDTYCYITNTYTLPSTFDMEKGLHQVAAPGLGPDTPEDDKVFHNYYMWVPYVLFLQALCFYVPLGLWKMVEKKKVMNILQGLNGLIVSDEEREKKELDAVDYLSKHWGRHTKWYIKYVFCETLSLLNILLQLCITNWFLGGEFMTYGSQAIEFTSDAAQNASDPMYEIFPRLTKCSFHRYGPSGSIEKFDSLCVLSINILNEKIYLALWFWFLFLLALSIMMVLYRLCTFIFRCYRTRVLLARGRYGMTNTAVRAVAEKCNIGDWYLLDTLGGNMNGLVFDGVLRKLHKALEDDDDDDTEKA